MRYAARLNMFQGPSRPAAIRSDLGVISEAVSSLMKDRNKILTNPEYVAARSMFESGGKFYGDWQKTADLLPSDFAMADYYAEIDNNGDLQAKEIESQIFDLHRELQEQAKSYRQALPIGAARVPLIQKQLSMLLKLEDELESALKESGSSSGQVIRDFSSDMAGIMGAIEDMIGGVQ